MSSLSSFTMLQTSNIVWQSVYLTDEVKINLEYDIHQGLLNIFVNNSCDQKTLPCHINILSNQSEESIVQSPSESQQEMSSDDDLEICYEISTIYTYDLYDENEQIDSSPTILTSLSSSSSCFDEQTFDNDDGYSTHSFDDLEQQQQYQTQLSLAIPSFRTLRPVYSSLNVFSEQYAPPIRRLIERMIWLNRFKKVIDRMMMNHRFL